MNWPRTFTAGLMGLVALSSSITSHAQTTEDSIDGHGFKLTAFDHDLRDLLTVQRPGAFHRGEWFTGAVFEYADQPVLQVTQTASGREEEIAALDNMAALNVSAGWVPVKTLRVDASIPVYFASNGLNQEPNGAGIGDIRLTAMFAPAQPDDVEEGEGGGIGIGIVPYIDLPTGQKKALLGQAGLSGGIKAAGTIEVKNFTLTGDLGLQINPTIELNQFTGTDQVQLGIGTGYKLIPSTAINLEGHIYGPLKKSADKGSETPAELLLTARHIRPKGDHYVMGVSTGLAKGVGTARFRIFLGGGFGVHKVPPKDFDLDGLVDPLDSCPEEPETFNQYLDEDGCPDTLGTMAVVVRYGDDVISGAVTQISGPDTNKTETSGAEPMRVSEIMPGTDWTASASVSCLAGEGTATATDSETELAVNLELVSGIVRVEVVDEENNPIPNATVKWQSDGDPRCFPSELYTTNDQGKGSQTVGIGKHSVAVTAPDYTTHLQDVELATGDDKLIRVTLKTTKIKVGPTQIVILDKVYFETAKAIIKPESFDLLTEVATTIRAAPDIGRIEVAGHTDNRGNDEYNLDLSQRRAESVKVYLIAQGVKAERLEAVGYGETTPIDTNRTEAGRVNNRRVEFHLLDVKKEGEP